MFTNPVNINLVAVIAQLCVFFDNVLNFSFEFNQD